MPFAGRSSWKKEFQGSKKGRQKGRRARRQSPLCVSLMGNLGAVRKKVAQAGASGSDSLKLVVSRCVADLKLKSTTAAAKERSAKMLGLIASQNEMDAAMVVEEGAIRALVAVLGGNSLDGLQMNVAEALAMLASSGRDKDAHGSAIVKAGAIPLLGAMLRGSPKVAVQAASALSAISEMLDHQEAIVRVGAIPLLVHLIRGGTADAQSYAGNALANLCGNNAEAQNSCAAAGGIPLLIAMLQSGKCQTAAARALAKLSTRSEAIRDEITSGGGVPPLLALLNSVSVQAQVQAAAALSQLSQGRQEVQACMYSRLDPACTYTYIHRAGRRSRPVCTRASTPHAHVHT